MDLIDKIDLRTIMVVCSVSLFIISMVIYISSTLFDEYVNGLLHWSSGAFSLGVAGFLFSIRDEIAPAAINLITSNVMCGLGFVLWLIGTSKFFNRPVNIYALLALSLVVFVAFAYMTIFAPNFHGRMMLMTVFYSIIYIVMLGIIIKSGREYKLKYIWCVLIMTVPASALIYILVTLLNLNKSTDLYNAVGINQFYIISICLSTQLTPVFFFLNMMQKLRGALENIANTDPLTEINNRRSLMSYIDKKKPANYNLYLIDLDDFKEINDKYGHESGDNVLKHFALSVGNILAENDFFARIGGEEFIIIKDKSTQHVSDHFIPQLQNEIKKITGDIPGYTISIGCAKTRNTELTFSELLNKADKALYRVKNSGKNSFDIEH